ncbi:hypothetical protein D9601_01090 [Sphingomonas sp. MA1305]|uniref:hypothetical protein n=1 Tax=unclassified Sphingomonas TaxID=196159 RepID=UPI0018E03A6D|nr:hypothetical protein [Sphingomonas sp. MA1305]MBI0473959.1 hypothetical protein [Sphingomonas sp. MA1305]
MFSIKRGEKMNPAQRRYLRRFFPAMGTYVVVLFTCTWLYRDLKPTGALLVLLSVLPALPIVAAILVMGAYLIEERDEFIRSRLVASMVGGLGIMLAITTVWGFLENGGAVAHFPTYLTFPLWCACFGLWQCVTGLRDRATGDAA